MDFANEIEELVYLEFQDIDERDYQDKIRYFERNKKAIRTLPYEVRLEMTLQYVISLFEVGDYYRYLKHVDSLLTRVIEDSLYSIDGDDIYQELLYRKAASFHNILDYYSADHVLGELCKIDKTNNIYKRTFLKNNMDRLRYQGQKVRAGIISMFLVSGIVIGIELLVIRPFYAEQIQLIEICRNSLFGGAILGIMLQEFRIRLKSWRKYSALVQPTKG